MLMMRGLPLRCEERKKDAFGLRTFLFLLAQVTTPCILSVCLADFLFAIVLLPIQASRWGTIDLSVGKYALSQVKDLSVGKYAKSQVKDLSVGNLPSLYNQRV